MNATVTALDFAPLLPWSVIAGLAGLALIATLAGGVMRLSGWIWRTLRPRALCGRADASASVPASDAAPELELESLASDACRAGGVAESSTSNSE